MVNVEEVRELLEARRHELAKKIHEIDDTLRQPDSTDWDDRAIENEGDEVLEDMGNAALDQIAQIDAALKRIEVGTYGKCAACGEDIDDNRLIALPFTATCVDCATESEKR